MVRDHNTGYSALGASIGAAITAALRLRPAQVRAARRMVWVGGHVVTKALRAVPVRRNAAPATRRARAPGRRPRPAGRTRPTSRAGPTADAADSAAGESPGDSDGDPDLARPATRRVGRIPLVYDRHDISRSALDEAADHIAAMLVALHQPRLGQAVRP